MLLGVGITFWRPTEDKAAHAEAEATAAADALAVAWPRSEGGRPSALGASDGLLGAPIGNVRSMADALQGIHM